MKNKIRLNIICLFSAIIGSTAISAAAQVATGGNFTFDQTVIASGGGVSSETSGNSYSIVGTIGQPIAGTTSVNSPFTLRSGFFTPELVAPTAAAVMIEGRVRTQTGAGIRNVQITLTESDGTIRAVKSGTFGNFRFDAVTVGQVVILSVSAKKFVFDQPVLIMNLTGDAISIEFIALEQ